MSIRELRKAATDEIFEHMGEDFELAVPGTPARPIRGIWQRAQAETDLAPLDVQSSRLYRVLAVLVRETDGLGRGSTITGPDVDIDQNKTFRVDEIDPRGDGTKRITLVPIT